MGRGWGYFKSYRDGLGMDTITTETVGDGTKVVPVPRAAL